MAVNKVILIGNVGKDPEIRATKSGGEVATFSLATTDRWRDKKDGQIKSKTEWHKIVVYSQGLVNITKNYVKKGSKLYIEGALQTRTWVGTDGQNKMSTEVVLQGFNSVLQSLDNRNNNNSSNNTSNYSDSENQDIPNIEEFVDEKIDDDIVF